MKPLPVVISFYTLDSPYEIEVQNLISSCQKFNIEHQIEGVPSAGSWELNCAFKPLFMLKKMEELQRPVLWVDADAVFLQPLSYAESFDADLSVRLNDCPDDHPSRIYSGTVYVNYTSHGMRLVKLWAQEGISLLQNKERKEEFWEQEALRNILFSKNHHAFFKPLPLRYACISGHPQDQKECQDPAILHFQASRRFKRWIDHPEERISGF
jgi:hypothetical protein